MREDPRLQEAKAIPIAEIADRLSIDDLQKAGRELTGPCPRCGGRDRFSINTDKDLWNCQHGCATELGADGIGLVRLVLACDFPTALTWLVGETDVEIPPEERARRDAERAKAARARDERAARERDKAIAAARDIWRQALPAEGTTVAAYLDRRGIDPAWLGRWPAALRFAPALPYVVRDDDRPGEWVTIHTGPAMVAAITDATNRVTAVHRTWIDLDQPKGKARIVWKGAPCKVKKTLGSMKGGAIRLGGEGPRETLIIGEGIETTLSARVAWARAGVHFWCGVSLGNMGGRRQLRGEGMKYRGIPDLGDVEAFLPPEGVRHLVFVQDGDSDPRLTRAKLLSGLRRARARVPSVQRISIVHAGDGRDLNDVLMDAGEDA